MCVCVLYICVFDMVIEIEKIWCCLILWCVKFVMWVKVCKGDDVGLCLRVWGFLCVIFELMIDEWMWMYCRLDDLFWKNLIFGVIVLMVIMIGWRSIFMKVCWLMSVIIAGIFRSCSRRVTGIRRLLNCCLMKVLIFNRVDWWKILGCSVWCIMDIIIWWSLCLSKVWTWTRWIWAIISRCIGRRCVDTWKLLIFCYKMVWIRILRINKSVCLLIFVRLCGVICISMCVKFLFIKRGV